MNFTMKDQWATVPLNAKTDHGAWDVPLARGFCNVISQVNLGDEVYTFNPDGTSCYINVTFDTDWNRLNGETLEQVIKRKAMVAQAYLSGKIKRLRDLEHDMKIVALARSNKEEEAD